MAEDVFRAIGVGIRRQLLDELAERDGQTLYELHARMTMKHGASLTRQALTRHLKVLEDAGLLTTEWRWRSKLHFLEPEALGEAKAWIDLHLNEGQTRESKR